MKTHNCRDCGAEFVHDTGKAGRPPVRCADCRVKVKERTDNYARVKATLSPTERVERLELLLKSRGLHPSQNRDEFER